MAAVDANSLAQLGLTVGILDDSQLREAWEELGTRGGEADPFLRLLERKSHLTPWQSHKLVKGDRTGYFLGGYKLLYKISSGSFGRVFRAEDKDSGQVVAIKVLRKSMSEKKHNVELFEREGRVGLTLKDPGIVEILGVHQDPPSKQYYIVMEFIEGYSLRDFLVMRKKLDAAESLRIMEDVVSGLSYATSRGVSHRDIKPTNILISSQGAAKLVDFGLAQIYAHHSNQGGPTDEKVDRTVDYAGLEEATGAKPGDVRSDIFFLGCVLFEMLTGHPPLPPTRDRHVRMSRQRFASLPTMNRDVVNGPSALFKLVETMMAVDPSQRFQTPSQLLDAIRSVRREVEDKPGTTGSKSTVRTVFVVEKDERLQDALREKFKKMGYRVLLAGDPERAQERFQQQAFDALVVDAGTTGKEGQTVFERILFDSERQGLSCSGILMLSEEQAAWASEIKERPNAAVLVRPVTLKQLTRKLQEMVPLSDSPAKETAAGSAV